jgi:predicted DNA-binding transcriptional regulator YafY
MTAVEEGQTVTGRQLVFEGVPREKGEPSGSLARTIAVLVRLLRSGAVDFAWYARHFEMSERQFMRDLRYLRTTCGDLGIRIGKRAGGRAELEGFDGRNRLGDDARGRDEALRAVARALGGPAAAELGAPPADGDDGATRFLLFAFPRLEDGTEAATIFSELKAAYEAKARVRFRYLGPRGDETARIVEPYRVLARSGRYFLIGYDVALRKGWRYFALDRIVGKPARSGTFVPRPIPPAFLTCDAVGMVQGGSLGEVTVRLSPAVAASIVSRRWQRAQRVVTRPDGSAEITFTVGDVDEVVRWSLGLGAEAVIVAPEAAISAARRLVQRLGDRYADEPAPAVRRGSA